MFLSCSVAKFHSVRTDKKKNRLETKWTKNVDIFLEMILCGMHLEFTCFHCCSLYTFLCANENILWHFLLLLLLCFLFEFSLARAHWPHTPLSWFITRYSLFRVFFFCLMSAHHTHSHCGLRRSSEKSSETAKIMAVFFLSFFSFTQTAREKKIAERRRTTTYKQIANKIVSKIARADNADIVVV